MMPKIKKVRKYLYKVSYGGKPVRREGAHDGVKVHTQENHKEVEGANGGIKFSFARRSTHT